MNNSIEFEDDELRAASNWHGGQSSMLYAIASTGSLRCGTIRPRHIDANGYPAVEMTDEEWFRDLCERLESEAESCVRACTKQLKGKRGKERDELRADRVALLSIASKCAEITSKGGL
jgi:hypothetical protein